MVLETLVLASTVRVVELVVLDELLQPARATAAPRPITSTRT